MHFSRKASSGYKLFFEIESQKKRFSSFEIQDVQGLLATPSDPHANEDNYAHIRQTTLVQQ